MDIIKRNFIYFYISFFIAGAANIIPQLFYAQSYPESKGLLLSLTLISGSVAAICGIRAAGKLLYRSAGAIIPVFIVFIASFLLLLIVKSPVFFILSMVAAFFTCEFLYNSADNYFLKITVNGDLNRHINTILVYQAAGYIVSPVVFSLLFRFKPLMAGIILLFAGIAEFASIRMVSEGSALKTEQSRDTRSLRQNKPLSYRERVFVAYSVSITMVSMMALSIMVYLLSDYFHLSDYAFKSSAVMVMIITLAVSVIFVMPHLKLTGVPDSAEWDERSALILEEEYHSFNPRLNLVTVACFMISIALIALKLDESYLYVILSILPMGPAYGFYLKNSRSYASMMDLIHKRSESLSVYNNITNISGIIGYAVVMVCWLVAEKTGLDYLKLTIFVMLGILVLSALLTAEWIRSLKLDRAFLNAKKKEDELSCRH